MQQSASPLRVLIVDDTVLYRKVLTDALSNIPGVEVIATAANGHIALSKIDQLSPDLITLDFEMPVMDGQETLRALKDKEAKPKVLMVSSHSQSGAQITLEALDLGAFDFITKPAEGDWAASQKSLEEQLRTKLGPLLQATQPAIRPTPPSAIPKPKPPPTRQSVSLVAIGVSTGGPKALAEVIPALPGNLSVPVVIVQHMPAMFTSALADSLNTHSAVTVCEASEGQTLQSGTVYLAPGGKQMRLVKPGAQAAINITDDPPEHFCKPAVDYLFRSVADIYGARCLGIILTGMGADGAAGLRILHDQGAPTLAQDEATSVVYGMPQEAVKAGGVDQVLPLGQIAPEIARICAL